MQLDLQNILIQLPLLVLLIYVIELRDKRWQEMMDKRDKQWQKFYEDQQENNKASMAEVAVALRENTSVAAQTHEMMVVHDQRVVAAIPSMQSAVRGDKTVASGG